VVYKLTEQTTLHAGYARYFTPPPIERVPDTTLSKFANTTHAPEVNQNDPVLTEKSHYFDVGVSHKLNTNIELGLNGYYKQSDHLLDEGQFGNSLILSPFNYKHGDVYGIESSLTYQQMNLQVYGNAAWSCATGKDIESAQFLFEQDELNYIQNNAVALDHAQRISISCGVSYSLKPLKLYADLLFGSGLRNGFANTSELPGYYTVNLGSSYDFQWPQIGHCVARLDLTNLTDSVYAIRDGSGIGIGAAQYGARRGVFTSIAIDL
jgi:outer membrane receptor protein involved in Fe transport